MLKKINTEKANLFIRYHEILVYICQIRIFFIKNNSYEAKCITDIN